MYILILTTIIWYMNSSAPSVSDSMYQAPMSKESCDKAGAAWASHRSPLPTTSVGAYYTFTCVPLYGEKK